MLPLMNSLESLISGEFYLDMIQPACNFYFLINDALSISLKKFTDISVDFMLKIDLRPIIICLFSPWFISEYVLITTRPYILCKIDTDSIHSNLFCCHGPRHVVY